MTHPKLQKILASIGIGIGVATGGIALVNTVFGLSEIKTNIRLTNAMLGAMHTQIAVVETKVDNLDKRIIRYESKLDNASLFSGTNTYWLQRFAL